jgi:hypothetical protein
MRLFAVVAMIWLCGSAVTNVSIDSYCPMARSVDRAAAVFLWPMTVIGRVAIWGATGTVSASPVCLPIKDAAK